MNIPLSTFPAPLLRLILCGGKGLAPAWGPLKHTDEDCETPWCPTFGAAIVSSDEGRGYLHTDPINESDGWSIPLDDASPWPARLALVSAWMLDLPCLAAQVQPETPELFFSLVMMPAQSPAARTFPPIVGVMEERWFERIVSTSEQQKPAMLAADASK